MLSLLVSGEAPRRSEQSIDQDDQPKTLPLATEFMASVPDERTLDYLMDNLKNKVDRPQSRAKQEKVSEEEKTIQAASSQAATINLPLVKRVPVAVREPKPKVIPEGLVDLCPVLKNPSEMNDFLNPDINLGGRQHTDVSRENAIEARIFLMRRKAEAREILRMLQQGIPFRTSKMAHQALMFFLQMDTIKKAAPYLQMNPEDVLFSDEERGLILGFARQFSKMDLASIQKAFSFQPFLGMDDQDLESELSVISLREHHGYSSRLHYSHLSYVDKVVLGLLFLQLENLANSSGKMTDVQMRFFEELKAYYVDQLEGIFCISIWRIEDGMKGFLKDTFFSVFTQKLNFEELSKFDFPFKARKLLEIKRSEILGLE